MALGGGHNVVNGFSVVPGNGSGNWHVWTPEAAFQPNVAAFACRTNGKHRLGCLELVGDEVHGKCAACGDTAVVPMVPEPGRALLRVLAFLDRLEALETLPEDDRRRAVVSSDLLGDFLQLVAILAQNQNDLDRAKSAVGVVRAKLAKMSALPDE